MHEPIDFQDARTFDAALDRLAHAVGGLGFDAVDYGFMPRARTYDGRYHAPTIVSRNFPQRWWRGWARYLRDDPLLYAAYPRNLPIDWEEVEDAPWLSAEQRQAFGYIRDHGFGSGVTVPIHLPDGAFAFVTAASRDGEATWRAATPDVSDRLLVLAHAFHAAQGPRPAAPVLARETERLTLRERAVLALAAAGLTVAESGERLHRSPETVRRQRKSAMQKLGAHKIAQAVVRAMQLGWLDDEVPERVIEVTSLRDP